MALAFAIYMIGILHSIDSGGWVFALLIGMFIYTGIKVGIKLHSRDATSKQEDERDFYTYSGKCVTNFAIVFTCAIAATWLAPDKETSYTMLAAYGLSEAYEFASENEDVQRIATKSLKLIEKHIDEYTENMDNETQDTQTEGE